MKKFDLSLRLILILALFIVASRLTHKVTQGFTIHAIQSNFPFNPDWVVQNPPLPDIFDQRFTFMGFGGQCYVFASEDGQYVIKFFKNRLNRVLPWQVARKKKLESKLNRDFTSYKIAMEKLPDETALLYVHLNKTDDLKKTVRIVDRLGIEHPINLDQVDFIVQRRAQMPFPRLIHFVQNNDLDSAKAMIDSIYNLLAARASKGIYDEDANVHRNCGFIDDKPIIIDVGRLKEDPTRIDPAIQRADFVRGTEKLRPFLKEISQDLSQYFEETYVEN